MLTLGTPGVCLKQKQEVTWSVQMVVRIWSNFSQLAMKLDEDSEEMKLRVTKLFMNTVRNVAMKKALIMRLLMTSDCSVIIDFRKYEPGEMR